MRASDTDRDRAARLLARHLADGRLTVEEFTERLDQAYTARTMEDLAATQHELPHVHGGTVDGPLAARRAGTDRAVLDRHLAVSVLLAGVLVVLWLVDAVSQGGLGTLWPLWPVLGWGGHLVLLIRALLARSTTRRG